MLALSEQRASNSGVWGQPGVVDNVSHIIIKKGLKRVARVVSRICAA
jgi:hypothetical protein